MFEEKQFQVTLWELIRKFPLNARTLRATKIKNYIINFIDSTHFSKVDRHDCTLEIPCNDYRDCVTYGIISCNIIRWNNLSQHIHVKASNVKSLTLVSTMLPSNNITPYSNQKMKFIQ